MGGTMHVFLPRILAFDIFGTVVDWHGSIVREMQRYYPQVPAADFARAWRAGYQPAMEQVRSGARGWARLDTLHRQILDSILPQFGLGHLDEEQRQQLNRVWQRLAPWGDAVAGLSELKQHFTICTLSNGNLGLLTAMAKHAGLPWDCILSAEVFRAYKPSPSVYLGVADIFGVEPSEVMLVAAHHNDLAAARGCGLQTAYIERPLEFGADQPKDVSAQAGNGWHARNLLDLSRQLQTTRTV
ncbi:haloacid dehalogenase type II [Comamonas sp. GB3 AK4-5]|uniref:haloacid dehalogenase type II n=1 Tax=Comamonas sp. GB3 AK4-5 TaxID=3231487 RepID=UPI00351F244A